MDLSSLLPELKKRLPLIELLLTLVGIGLLFFLLAPLDLFERLSERLPTVERFQLDELLIVLPIVLGLLLVYNFVRFRRLIDRDLELSRKNELLRIIYEVPREISHQSASVGVAQAAVNALEKWTSWQGIMLLEVGDVGQELVVMATSPLLQDTIGKRFPVEDNFVGRALLQEKSQKAGGGRGAALDARAARFLSSLAVPLRRQRQVVGVLTLHSAEEEGFPPDGVRLAEVLAEGIGLALAHEHQGRALEQQASGLNMLYNVSRQLNRREPTPAVLQNVLLVVHSSLGFTGGMICRVGANGRLEPSATRGYSAPEPGQALLSLANYVKTTADIVNIPQIEQVLAAQDTPPRLLHILQALQRQGEIAAVVGLPLLDEGEVVGTMVLAGTQPRRASHAEEGMLVNVGRQIVSGLRR